MDAAGRLKVLKRTLLLWGWVCLLAGCAAPPTATPAPTPVAVRVAFTPTLRLWQGRLAECAAGVPGLVLFTEEMPAGSLDVTRFDTFLRLGYPPQAGQAVYAAALGEMEIGVIVQRTNPLKDMDLDTLRAIFEGHTTQWEDGSSIQPWTYPVGDDVRQGLEAALGASLSNPQAHLAPDPEAMRTAVSADPAAIGYLPAAWLAWGETGAIRQVELNQTLADALRQPVLAFGPEEPQGAMGAWWSCLQSAGQP